jgi:hypothetical protein
MTGATVKQRWIRKLYWSVMLHLRQHQIVMLRWSDATTILQRKAKTDLWNDVETPDDTGITAD